MAKKKKKKKSVLGSLLPFAPKPVKDIAALGIQLNTVGKDLQKANVIKSTPQIKKEIAPFVAPAAPVIQAIKTPPKEPQLVPREAAPASEVAPPKPGPKSILGKLFERLKPQRTPSNFPSASVFPETARRVKREITLPFAAKAVEASIFGGEPLTETGKQFQEFQQGLDKQRAAFDDFRAGKITKEEAKQAFADSADISTRFALSVLPGSGGLQRIGQKLTQSVAKELVDPKLEKFQERLATGDAETLDIIKDIAQISKDKTRGKVSFGDAVKNLGDTKLAPRTLKNLPEGKALNKEETLVATGLIKDQLEKVKNLKNEYERTGSKVVQTQIAAEQELLSSYYASLRGARAEAGRALENWKNINKMLSLPEKRIVQIDKFLSKQGQSIDDFTEQLSRIDLEDEAQVFKFLREANKPSFKDFLFEIRVNGLLSGLKTHLRNVAGNSLFAAIRPIEKTIAAAVDIPVSKLQGRSRERFFGEAIADIEGKAAGLLDVGKSAFRGATEVKDVGVKEFKRLKKEAGEGMSYYSTFKGGVLAALDELDTKINKLGQQRLELENFRAPALKGPVGKVVRTPTTMLQVGDEIFKTMNVTSELYSQAYRRAASKSKNLKELKEKFVEIMDNPDAKLLKGVHEESERLLFRAEPGAFTNWINQGRRKSAALQILFPFVNTPVNIIKEGLKRTPLNVGALAKNRGTVQFSDDLSQIVFGSSIATMLALSALEGDVTGSGSSYSKKELDALRRQGWQPYSIRIGDKWVGYQTTEPLFLNLSTVADIVEQLQNDPKETLSEEVSSVALSIIQNVTSQSYLTGLNDLVKAMNEPDRYGSQFAGNVATSFVPFSSLLRSVSNQKGESIKRPEGAIEKIQSILPGANQDLPPLRDLWGRPVLREASSFSPFNVSESKEDPLEKILSDAEISLSDLNREVYGVKLNQRNYSEYKKWRQNLKDFLDSAIQAEGFTDQSLEEQRKFIEGATRAFDKQLKQEVGAKQVIQELGLNIPPEAVPFIWDNIEDKTNFKKLLPEKKKELFERFYQQMQSAS